MEYSFKTKLWEYRPESPDQKIGLWVFASIPQEYYEEIKEFATPHGRGFGSVRVAVRVGTTSWNTSIFPDTKYGTYVLPVKKEIRKKEGINVGDVVSLAVKITES